MDLVIVYKANPESYVKVVQALREERFSPVAIGTRAKTLLLAAVLLIDFVHFEGKNNR